MCLARSLSIICMMPCTAHMHYGAVHIVNRETNVASATAQTAAGSVVGRSIIAIAKQKGVKTINVVRRREQKQELLDLG